PVTRVATSVVRHDREIMPVDLVRGQSRRLKSGWEKVKASDLSVVLTFVFRVRLLVYIDSACLVRAVPFALECPVDCKVDGAFSMQAVQIRQTTTKQDAKLQAWLRRMVPGLVVLGLLAVWQVIVILEIYPTFIIPAPQSVAERFVEVLA